MEASRDNARQGGGLRPGPEAHRLCGHLFLKACLCGHNLKPQSRNLHEAGSGCCYEQINNTNYLKNGDLAFAAKNAKSGSDAK